MRGYHNNIKKTSLKDVPNKMFNSIFHKPLGQDIYGFLRLELTIIRMIDAANLGRASVDPICDDIYKSFQYEFEKMTSEEFDKWKQYIGYMIKFEMEINDYIPAGRNIAIRSDNGEKLGNIKHKKRKCFSYGTKYKVFTKTKGLKSLDLNDKEQMKALSKLLKKEGLDDSWIEKFLENNSIDSKE